MLLTRYSDPNFSKSIPDFRAVSETILNLGENKGSLSDHEFRQLLEGCNKILAKWDSTSAVKSRGHFAREWEALGNKYFEHLGVLPSEPSYVSPWDKLCDEYLKNSVKPPINLSLVSEWGELDDNHMKDAAKIFYYPVFASEWGEFGGTYTKIPNTSTSKPRSKGASAEGPESFYYWTMLAYFCQALWCRDRTAKTHRERAELAYAFASKVVIECGSTTDTNIRLDFYRSFACFMKEAMITKRTRNSLLWYTLSTLSSKDMGDPDLVKQLLAMRDSVTQFSRLDSDMLKSRLPNLCA